MKNVNISHITYDVVAFIIIFYLSYVYMMYIDIKGGVEIKYI